MVDKQVPVQYLNLYTEVVRLASRLEGWDEKPTDYMLGPERKKMEEKLVAAIRKYRKEVPANVQPLFALDMDGLEKLLNKRVAGEHSFFEAICDSSKVFDRPFRLNAALPYNL